MKSRGEKARKRAESDIINGLIFGPHTASSLARENEISRTALSKILDGLIRDGFVERRGERSFAIAPKSCFIFAFVGRAAVEISTYCFDCAEISRKSVKCVPSMSFNDNLIRIFSLIDRHILMMSDNGYRVYVCAVPENDMIELSPSATRLPRLCKKDLIAAYLSMKDTNGRILYLDGYSSLFYTDSAYVGGNSLCKDIKAVDLDNLFSLILPDDLIALRSEADTLDIERVCRKHGVSLTLIDRKTLTPCEIGAISQLFIRLLEKLE